MGAQLNSIFLSTEHVANCFKCGVPILAASGSRDRLTKDKSTFYCLNGHSQGFYGLTATERENAELKRKLEIEQRQREWAQQRATRADERADSAQRSANSYKGKLRSVKERVKNGVCPCCQRSFVQLARHMASKHPGFAVDSAEEAS